MTRMTYQIIRHRGGWAYLLDETLSETFPTHAGARLAAGLAARELSDRADTSGRGSGPRDSALQYGQ
jgi:hypothetical protein